MPTISNYPGGTPIKRSAGGRAAGSPSFDVIENTYDAARANAAIGDTVVLMTIPANTFVGHVFLETIKGEAGVTLAIGDAATPNGWMVAAAIGTVDGVVTKGGGAYATAGGKLYTAETDITLLTGTAVMDLAKVRVVALVATLG